MAEICATRWTNSGASMQIEKKDEIKKRLGRSPDRTDAVAMTLLSDRSSNGGWVLPDPSTRPPAQDPRDQMFRAPRYGGSRPGFMGVW